jgi:hypothetical protein
VAALKKQQIFTAVLISLLCLSFITIFPFSIPLAKATEITRVQGNEKATVTNEASIEVNMSDTPTAGNLLVAATGIVATDSAQYTSSISQTGVTWTKQIGPTYSTVAYLTVEIWVGVVESGAESNMTFNLHGTANATADVCEYSGLLTSGFLDKTAFSNSWQYYVDSGTTATTTQANELWIGALLSYGGLTQSDPTDGFTLLDGNGTDNGMYALGFAEKVVSETGAAHVRATCDESRYIGCIATFKAKSGYPPSASNILVSTVNNGSSCTFSCNWSSIVGETTLSGFIFGSNASGSWVNQTWAGFSGTPTSEWANATDDLPSSVGVTVQFRWWANDSDNNWGDSELQNLFTLSSVFLQIEGSKIQSSLVTGTNASQGIRHQEKSFYAAGRFWVFYMEKASGYPYYGYYTSSADGLTWANPVCLNVSSLEYTGENIQVLLDDSGIAHIFYRTGTTLYYGSATPNSNGTLTWKQSLQNAISPSSSNTDFCAALDADGYPWVVWAYGSSLSTQTVYAYKDAYNNGSWSTASGFPLSVVGPGYWSNNMIVPLSNGDIYFLYYRAGVNPIYGKLYNGTLGDQETCSESSIIVDYASASESWNRAWTVDDDDNIFLSFLNTDNELVVMLRDATTEAWSAEATVQTEVIDGASPSLNWVDGFLNLFWIYDASTIANEVVQNAVPDSETLTYSEIVGQIPLSNPPSDGPGFLNAFTFNFGDQPALLYITNMTIPTSPYYTYQICLGLFDFESYTITTSAGTGGTITPESAVVVQGASQDFTVTPNALYVLRSVTIDSGENIANTTDAMTIHFTNVQANHTLAATFTSLQGDQGTKPPQQNTDNSNSALYVGDLDLGNVQANQTVTGHLTISFEGSSMTIVSVSFSPPFDSWLTGTTSFITGNSPLDVGCFFLVPDVQGSFEGKVTVSALDASGRTLTATAKVSAQVGESSGLDLLTWMRENPLLMYLLAIGTFLVLGAVAVFTKRKH